MSKRTDEILRLIDETLAAGEPVGQQGDPDSCVDNDGLPRVILQDGSPIWAHAMRMVESTPPTTTNGSTP